MKLQSRAAGTGVEPIFRQDAGFLRAEQTGWEQEDPQ